MHNDDPSLVVLARHARALIGPGECVGSGPIADTFSSSTPGCGTDPNGAWRDGKRARVCVANRVDGMVSGERPPGKGLISNALRHQSIVEIILAFTAPSHALETANASPSVV